MYPNDSELKNKKSQSNDIRSFDGPVTEFVRVIDHRQKLPRHESDVLLNNAGRNVFRTILKPL